MPFGWWEPPLWPCSNLHISSPTPLAVWQSGLGSARKALNGDIYPYSPWPRGAWRVAAVQRESQSVFLFSLDVAAVGQRTLEVLHSNRSLEGNQTIFYFCTTKSIVSHAKKSVRSLLILFTLIFFKMYKNDIWFYWPYNVCANCEVGKRLSVTSQSQRQRIVRPFDQTRVS